MTYKNILLFILFFISTQMLCNELTFITHNDSCQIINDSTLHITYFKSVDEMPTYRGGEHKLFMDLIKHIEYPSTFLEIDYSSKIIFSFIINPDGKISHFDIIKPKEINAQLRKNLMELQKYIDHWNPGKCNGKAVAVRYYLPLNICIQ